jgi:calcineurin-like phosphoesterase family protein
MSTPNIFFTSDTHFGHENINTLCNRPLKTGAEADELLIEAINSVVQPRDTLYHLGDFAWNEPDYFRRRIDCRRIHLVEGNHDRLTRANRLEFASVSELLRLVIDRSKGYKFILCHYPFQRWRRRYYHLHGHTHGLLTPPRVARRFDVGVDAYRTLDRAFGRPWALEELVEAMRDDGEQADHWRGVVTAALPPPADDESKEPLKTGHMNWYRDPQTGEIVLV